MLCRLCLLDSTIEVINIFEGDGEQLKIADIIGQHFWFVPKKDDQISYICCNCWLKVDKFHQFYCFIKDAQKNLSKILLIDQKEKPSYLPQQNTMIYLNQENNDHNYDEWICDSDTEVFEYNGDVLKDDIVNYDRKIDSKHCDIDTEVFEYNGDVLKNDIVNDDRKIDSKHCDNDTEVFEYNGDVDVLKDDIVNDNRKMDSKHCDIDTEVFEYNGDVIKDDIVNDDRKIDSKHCDNDNDENDKSDSDSDQNTNHQNKKLSDEDIQLFWRLKKSEKDDLIASFMKLKCEICHKEFKTFAQMNNHYLKNHNKKGYVICCNKKLNKKIELINHINLHRNPNYYKCDVCNKTYSNKYNLKNHMLSHENETENSKTIECDQCNKKFLTEITLMRHKLIVHIPPEDRLFKCDDCDKTFSTKYLLQAHQKTLKSHKNEYELMCHICAKTYTSKSNFKKHQLEHAGIVEKIQCGKCGIWLKGKYCLKKHMDLHIERLSIHKCNICEKTLTTRKALNSHIKYVHECKKIHQCEICNMAFKMASRLKEHIAIHTREILYSCSYCPKKFNSKINFYTHKKKLHPKEWEREESRKDRISVPPENGISAETDSDIKFEDDKSNEKNFSISKKNNYYDHDYTTLIN